MARTRSGVPALTIASKQTVASRPTSWPIAAFHDGAWHTPSGFHPLTGPKGPLVRAPDGARWVAVTEHDGVAERDEPRVEERGHATPGLVTAPTGLVFYRDARRRLA